MAQTVSGVQVHGFAGFYESIYTDSVDSSIEYDCESPEDRDIVLKDGESLDYNDWEVDWTGYKQEIVRDYCTVFKSYCPDFVQEIVAPELDSPRYYNFRTDEIFADFVLDDDYKEKIISFINSNREWFAEQLRKNHTSYDGFISFMTNKVDEWIEEVKDGSNSQYVACSIYYIICKTHGEDIRHRLNEETYEDVYADYWLTDEAIAEKVESIDGVPASEYLSNKEK